MEDFLQGTLIVIFTCIIIFLVEREYCRSPGNRISISPKKKIVRPSCYMILGATTLCGKSIPGAGQQVTQLLSMFILLLVQKVMLWIVGAMGCLLDKVKDKNPK